MNVYFLVIFLATMPLGEPERVAAYEELIPATCDVTQAEDQFLDTETIPPCYLVKASVWSESNRENKEDDRFIFGAFTLVVAERQRCEFNSGGSTPASEFLINRPLNFGTKMSAMVVSLDEETVQLDSEVSDASGVTGTDESENFTHTIRTVCKVKLNEKKVIAFQSSGQKLGMTVKITRIDPILGAANMTAVEEKTLAE